MGRQATQPHNPFYGFSWWMVWWWWIPVRRREPILARFWCFVCSRWILNVKYGSLIFEFIIRR